MRRLGLWTFLLVAALTRAAWGQVSVEVVQEQRQFLPGESMAVAVRITNRSGRTLHLGAEADWLTFTIEDRQGRSVPRNGEVPVIGEFDLESSKVATKRVDLAPYFALTEPDHYILVATVRIKGLEHETLSPPKEFDLINGARLWEQEFGLPQSGGGNATPEVRKYILQQANYLKGQIRLYLRITDSSGGRTFRVFPIGPMLSFSRPEPQIDGVSRLHLLYQNGPTTFSYSVFNPEGEVLLRQTFDYVGARPRLSADAAGNIAVMGGARRFAPTDIPTPVTPETIDSATTNAPAPAAPSDEVKTPQKP
ncbi:MAG TPA: hypothetical protein VNZ22_03625 [Bacillota bacterium]|nr:hypothetical protein [Bacillota bacterium]